MKRILPLVFAALTILLWSAAGDAQQARATADGQAAPPPATVTGAGTTNFIPLWTGSTTLGNSKLFQTGAMELLVLPHFVDNTALGIQAMQTTA